MSILFNSGKVPQVTLGNGDTVPCIGMGTFGSDHANPGEVSDAIAGAIKHGYRLFDCASVYGNEDQIGAVFAAAINDGIIKREDIYVTSKIWNDKHGKGDVPVSIAHTLKDLQFDYIDCYFVHWPFPNYHAPGCAGDTRNPDSKPFSVEAFMSVWRQMEHLVDMNLARSIGMSNMTIPKLDAVLPLCRVKPVLIEMELHPAFQQPELFEYCISKGIQPIGYSPLGSPNRPERDRTPDDIAATEMPEIIKIAKAHGIHPTSVCLKWAVQIGAIPIPFSVNERNYIANLECVLNDPLTEYELEIIKKADKNCRLIKGQVFLWRGAKSWEDLWDIDGIITK